MRSVRTERCVQGRVLGLNHFWTSIVPVAFHLIFCAVSPKGRYISRPLGLVVSAVSQIFKYVKRTRIALNPFVMELKAAIYHIAGRHCAPWQYLETGESDARFLVAAGYLCNKIAHKNLVDLNCGTARLLDFLPDTFASYYGNDTDEHCISIARAKYSSRRNVAFELESDIKAVKTLRCKKVDVLMLFGFGAGNITKGRDSATLMQSFFDLVEYQKPEVLIVESSKFQDEKFGQVRVILERLLVFYKVIHAIQIAPISGDDHAHLERLVYILERLET